MSERGYITIAQASGDTDYLRMAYALALSLKATQSEVSDLTVLVTPGMDVPNRYLDVFDKVIEIPWGDDAESFEWKIHNKWKVFHLTPYQETVLLDADMIFPEDVSHWWETLYERDVWISTKPVTYRGKVVRPGRYRTDFVINDLPMAYTAFMYFQQCDVALELFNVTKAVYHEWGYLQKHYRYRTSSDDDLAAMANVRSPLRLRWTHFFQNFPRRVSGDLAFAIATKLMGREDEFTSDRPFPTFTHMKPADQGLMSAGGETWSDLLPHVLTDELKLTVGGYRQLYPFHYVEKDWLTDDVLRKLEAANG